MMRDQRKSPEYFEQYLIFEKRCAAKREEKLSALTDDDARAKTIYGNLLHYRMNILIASFSAGSDAETLCGLLDEACTAAMGVEFLTFSDALTLSSLAILLHNPRGIRDVMERFPDVFDSDKLLYGFSTFLAKGQANWSGKYRFPDTYQNLDSFFSAQTPEQQEDALLSFLSIWYEKCDDCAWYDTLDNANDVYYGYWCFEAGALGEIFQLNSKKLSVSEYFPVV